MTYRNHAEDIAAAMAEHNRAQERDEILREQFKEDIPMNYTTPEPLRSQVYVEHFSGPFATSPRKVRRSAIAGFPWLTFAGWVLVFILATGLLMIAATHVTERTAATVSGAHIKAMY